MVGTRRKNSDINTEESGAIPILPYQKKKWKSENQTLLKA